MNLKLKPLLPLEEFKKLGEVRYATAEAAGIDFRAPADGSAQPGEVTAVDLQISVELPAGTYLDLRARSGFGRDFGMFTVGSCAVDSDYRGPIVLLFSVLKPMRWKKGDRICQGIVTPCHRARIDLVEELTPSGRGNGGLGSTGKA